MVGEAVKVEMGEAAVEGDVAAAHVLELAEGGVDEVEAAAEVGFAFVVEVDSRPAIFPRRRILPGRQLLRPRLLGPARPAQRVASPLSPIRLAICGEIVLS